MASNADWQGSISNFTLRLPPRLIEDVKMPATQDAVSVNPFLAQAVAEKW